MQWVYILKLFPVEAVRTDWVYLLTTPKFMLVQCALLLHQNQTTSAQCSERQYFVAVRTAAAALKPNKILPFTAQWVYILKLFIPIQNLS